MDKKQRTKTGHEIPIPKRKDFDATPRPFICKVDRDGKFKLV